MKILTYLGLGVSLFYSIGLVATSIQWILQQRGYVLRWRVAVPIAIVTVPSLCILTAVVARYTFLASPASLSHKLDSTPLQRPVPLVSLQSTDTDSIIAICRDALAEKDFQILVLRDKTIEGRRTVRKDKCYDSALIWLGRDAFESPAVTHVFVLTARYEEILAAHTDFYRVEFPSEEKSALLVHLQMKLLAKHKQP